MIMVAISTIMAWRQNIADIPSAADGSLFVPFVSCKQWLRQQ
jgi:hypothetical protein